MKNNVEKSGSLWEAVVFAVSEAEGKDPVEMPPLGSVLDTEALDRLFDGELDDPEQVRRVSFRYSESVVTIDGSESVTVEPLGVEDE